MNKTVNINLANVLFHIDEEAYNKMRLYLESIKRSFDNTPGNDEILADIEARIAELFQEKLENERQVISQKEVDDVIAIMGQPEDYMVDEDIFEDEPTQTRTENSKRAKKLYRDTEIKYVAGVSSGLAHFIGIDPLWVRLLWVLLTVGSGGGFILLYGLLWILIPEARTTSQKLDMRGEDINISNIERTVKEGFDDVAEKIKNVDYEGVGKKVKNGSKTFFDTLGEIIMFLFKVFGKFIGILLIIIGATTIIGMFIGMLTTSTLDWLEVPGMQGIIHDATETPIWIISLLAFFVIAIPFFFLLYLGLKILVNNLKSIGKVAKFSLLGLWLISLISLIVIGIKEASAHAFTGTVTEEKELSIENTTTPLNVELVSSTFYDADDNISMNDMVLVYDNDGHPILQSEDIRFNIRKSKDTIALISVRKEANGPSYNEARKTAESIKYQYKLEKNHLILDNFLTTTSKSKLNDQEVRVNLYLPVGTLLKYTPASNRNWTMRTKTDRAVDGLHEYLWKMGEDGELKCQDCPEKEAEQEDNNNRVIINENGIDIDIKDNGESFKMKIDENGLNIKAQDNEDEDVTIKIDENGVKLKTNDSI